MLYASRRQRLIATARGIAGPQWVVPIGVWLATRVGIGTFALAVHQYVPGAPRVLGNPTWPARLLFGWDSLHFYGIASRGYDFTSGQSHDLSRSPAFFPGYPLAARGLAALTGGTSGAPLYWSMAVLSWAGALVGALALWRIAADRWTPLVANRAVVLLLAGPWALFLVASYSEGLFLAFAATSWLAATRRHWWMAGVLAALAGATRINGVFLGVALIVMFIAQRPRSWKNAPALVLPFLGTFAYSAWLKAETGSWTTWLSAEKEWHRRLTAPWTSLERSINYAFHPIDGRPFPPAAELFFAALALAIVITFATRRMWPELVYVGISLLSLVISSWYVSIPRSFLLMFPAFVLLAELTTHRRWRWTYGLMLTISLSLLAVNTMTFVLNQWTD